MNSNLETDVTTIFWSPLEKQFTDEQIQSQLHTYYESMSEFYKVAKQEIETGVEHELLDNFRDDEDSMTLIKQDLKDNFDIYYNDLANELTNENWDRKKFKEYFAMLSLDDVFNFTVYYEHENNLFYEPVFIDVFRTQELQDIRLKSYQETIDYQ